MVINSGEFEPRRFGTASDVQILRSIRSEINGHLTPLARTTTEHAAARMVDNMLGHLIVNASRAPDYAWLSKRRDLLEDMAKHVAQSVSLDPEQVREQSQLAAIALERLTAADFTQVHYRIDALIEQLAALILRRPAEGAGADRGRALLARLASNAAAAMQAKTLAMAEEIRTDTALREATASPLTPERLEFYLLQRFGKPNIRVLEMLHLAGGFSKSTVMVRLSGIGEGETEIVIKRDMLASATETSVVDEYPILVALHEQGLAVPEPMWLEPDPAKLGYPCMFMRKAPGSIAGSLWAPSPAFTRQTALDIAGFLAKLHALDPSKLELGPTLDASLDPRAQELNVVKILREGWTRKRLEPDPLIEASLCWMEANQPAPPSRISILHSDIGFNNMLILGDRLSVALDWELVQLGDAASNLIYLRPQIENILPWEEFMAEYVRHGGEPYDQSKEVYYQTWRSVRGAIGAVYTLNAFAMDQNLELRMGHTGIIDLPVLSLMSAEPLK